MNEAKQAQTAERLKFDTKPYERPGLTETDILDIKETFDVFDKDHSGIINPKELKLALSSLGPQAKNEPIYQFILDCDAEGAGWVTFEQFIHLLTPKLLHNDSRENINSIFKLFDSEKVGFLMEKDLRRISHELCLGLSEEQICDMIKRADEDKDGRVSPAQFYNLMASISK